MGSLLVFDGTPRIVPLAPTTLVGRGAACLARLQGAGVPAHWLEVRWLGEAWAWRALAGEDSTRGPHTLLAPGWRALGQGGRMPRVSLGEQAWIELADPSPPAPFAWDLVRDAPVEERVLERHLEARPSGFVPLDAGPAAARLADGQVLALHDPELGPLALRLHVPDTVRATEDAVLDLLGPGLSVDLDADDVRSTLHQGRASVTVRGESARVLTVYLHARRADVPHGGWLTPAEAWEAWVALGGNPASPTERLSWERGKLRAQLARMRVANVHALFEIARQGDTIRTRLGVDVSLL